MQGNHCSDQLPRFAGAWIQDWNSGDVARIAAHYAADVRPGGRAAIEARLRARPGLRLMAVARGSAHATIVYRAPGGRLMCETVRLGEDGLIVESDVQWAEPAQAPAWRRLGAALLRGADGVLTWIERSRERQALARLDHHLLKDLGIDRTQAIAEADKPFWRE